MIDKREFAETLQEALDKLLILAYEGKTVTVLENVLVRELPHRDRKMIAFVSWYLKEKGYFKNGRLTAQAIEKLLLEE